MYYDPVSIHCTCALRVCTMYAQATASSFEMIESNLHYDEF